MADYGIKTSKNINSVLTAKDRELLFSSKFSHLKLVAKGMAPSTSFTYAHQLGYAPFFEGYIKNNGKYFVNYSTTPVASEGFENYNFGKIYVDKDNLYTINNDANQMVWLLFANPITLVSGSNNRGSLGNYGLKFGTSIDSTFREGNLSLTSKFQTPFIVDQGVVKVTAAEFTVAQNDTGTHTDFIDKVHNLRYAAHMVVDYNVGAAGFWANYVGPPIGFEFDYVLTDFEFYIDVDKIRFRVSRSATSSPFGPFTPSAVDYYFNYYLTNIKLP